MDDFAKFDHLASCIYAYRLMITVSRSYMLTSARLPLRGTQVASHITTIKLTMVAPFVKRPTSPLHFETAAVVPEDVLYLGSEDDYSTERHRKKRRRIEELGQQYLEGKPLVIFSASLRGPLASGWVNPWAKRKAPTTAGFRRALGQPNTKIHRQDSRGQGKAQTTGSVSSKDLSRQKESRRNGSGLSNAGSQVSSVTKVKNIALEPTKNQDRSSHAVEISRSPTSATNHISRPENTSVESVVQKQAPPVSGSSRTADWLKSDKTYLDAPIVDDTRSFTPTPTSRPPLPTKHTIGFTPINKPATPVQNARISTEEPVLGVRQAAAPTKAQPQVLEEPGASHYPETILSEAGVATWKGYASAKAIDEESNLQARNRASQAVLPPEPLSKQMIATQNNETTATFAGHSKTPIHMPKATPHQLPPSTNLAEFQYRLARKKPPPSFESVASNDSSFAVQMKAAKAKAEAQSIKRLSFTGSGVIKSFDSKSTSRASSASPKDRSKAQQQVVPSEQEPSRNKARSPHDAESFEARLQGRSDGQMQGPEAQQVSLPIFLSEDPSGPSMNPFGAAKQVDEDDSYLDLSTQAAILKAQGSLQNGIEISPQHLRTNGVIISQPSPTAYKTPRGKPPQLPKSLVSAPEVSHRTPDADALSTQAMMDAISPFALTTAKRPNHPNLPVKFQNRTSFALSPLVSPSHAFGSTRRSLSMSTSSDSLSPTGELLAAKAAPAAKPPPPVFSKVSTGMSKPPSTATSTAFSIAPNGTLTEVYQQDGQQPHDGAMGMEGWDLDEAIEEAGSFLATGTWDVEVEARKEGSVHAKSSGR